MKSEYMRAALEELLGHQQGPTLYMASLKTFWPGSEKWVHGDGENKNELIRIGKEYLPEYASLAEQQAEVKRIQRSAFAKEHWPKFAAAAEVVLRTEPDPSSAHTDYSSRLGTLLPTIYLPDTGWGRSRAVLLHELAHAVDAYENPITDPFRAMFDDGHGARFAKLNIEMIREFYSKEMGDKLEANFKAGGVEIAP